jgi:hypothetical protein
VSAWGHSPALERSLAPGAAEWHAVLRLLWRSVQTCRLFDGTHTRADGTLAYGSISAPAGQPIPREDEGSLCGRLPRGLGEGG